MKTHAILCALICLLIPLCACAEGLEEAAPITGIVTMPAGADPGSAVAMLCYTLPQFVAQSEADNAVNRCYQDLSVTISEAFYQNFDAFEPRTVTEDTYRVERNDASYLCILRTTHRMAGGAANETIVADTFARDGLYAGQRLSLSQVLGMEQADSSDSQASRLVYRLVYEIIRADMRNGDSAYLDSLTEDSFYAAFSPESDFYLDADGNIVFYIQSGVIAGEIAGVLTFPFARAEIFSAVNE